MKKWMVHLASFGAAVSVLAVSVGMSADAFAYMPASAQTDPLAGIVQGQEPGIAEIESSLEGEWFDGGTNELPFDISEDDLLNVSVFSSVPLPSVSDGLPGESALSSESSIFGSSLPPFESAPAESSSPASSRPPVSSAPSSSPSSEESEPDDELLLILAGAVQREIVGTNTVPSAKYYEAYKAQAVACHSYMENYRRTYGRYPSMSYATPHAKTIALVREVYDEVAYYGSVPANTVYHAAAGGHTQSSQYVWGSSVSYLKAVDSAYDDYPTTFSISAESARQKLTAAGISVSGEPETWFSLDGATYTDGDFVYTLPVCGVQMSARTLRESVFGTAQLKSTKITSISVSGDVITFSTKGYGHGVGMSQRGALGYSAAGKDYRFILTHYYPGITIR